MFENPADSLHCFCALDAREGERWIERIMVARVCFGHSHSRAASFADDMLLRSLVFSRKNALRSSVPPNNNSSGVLLLPWSNPRDCDASRLSLPRSSVLEVWRRLPV